MSKSISAVSSFTALFVAIVSVNSHALDPAAFKVGGFNVIPTLGLDVTHDDNIYTAASNETSSTITTVSPGVQAKARIGTTDVVLAYQHSAGSYSSNSADDFNDNSLSSDVSWELNGRNQLDFNAGFNQGHESRDSATVGSTPDEFDETSFGAKYTYGGDTSKGRLVFNYDLTDKEFMNNRATTVADDRKNATIGGIFFWGIASKTDVLFEVKTLDVDYASASVTTDSTANAYNVGVAWEATGKTSGTVKVGQTKKDFDNAARVDATLDSWEAELSFSPKSYSVLSVNSARDARESDGTGNFIDSKSYGANWQHGWNDRLNSNVYASFDNETYNGATREDDTNTFGVRVDYNLKSWLDLGVSADYTDRDSTQATSKYEGSKIALHLLMGL